MKRRCLFCADTSALPLDQRYWRCQLCNIACQLEIKEVPIIKNYKILDDTYEFPNWNTWLFRVTGKFLPQESYLFSLNTVMIWALREKLHLENTGTTVFGRTLNWKYGKLIRANVGLAAQKRVPSLTLGILATPASLDETINLCVETEELISEVIVALDASQSDVNFTQKLQAACGVPVTVIAHSLDGDFAAQRNRIQAASSSPWVLQLDTDERLTKAAKRRIPWLLAEAEVAGWQGFALPRQNVVDGVVSAHYPDVQYRLLRQDIRFVRRVHEYPNLPQGRSMLALGTDILHYMASERLLHRERLYEKMMTGAGRPYDTALLQIPLGNEVRIPK